MAMIKRYLHFFIVFSTVCLLQSQTLKGIVLDAKTNLPIESAAIYFDGTTIGTSSNSEGNFKITLVEGVTSPLIISFMGYQRVVVNSYNPDQFYKVMMAEDVNTLEEVVISTDDGMSKAEKLKQFRREFLGVTENGRSCRILNESDLNLRYNQKKKQLTASARRPIMVENDNLKYLISFELQDFVINYSYVDLLGNYFKTHSVTYLGTSFYTDQDTLQSKKTVKQRERTYEGSHTHFMRSLSNKRLKEDGYKIFDKSFEVPPYKFIQVDSIEDSKNVKISISKQLNILFDKKRQSKIELLGESFVIDQYGNYAPIENVLFSGDLGTQRLGDAMPFDYQFVDKTLTD